LGPASNDTLPHTITPKDGSTVLIRRADPEDFQMLFSMFGSLSADTMFRRFLRSQKRLSQEDVREMFRLDDRSVTSLKAILQRDHEERAIGEARYATDSTGKLGEAAIVIADEWQNRGLGTALFSDLIADAKKQELSRMFAYIDVENRAIIRVGQKVGLKLAPRESGTDYSMTKAEILF